MQVPAWAEAICDSTCDGLGVAVDVGLGVGVSVGVGVGVSVGVGVGVITSSAV